MATLYVIGTPIGNLEDITLRALRILKEVDVVLCEDTRVTKRLLDRYGIHVQMISYHSQSGKAKEEKIMDLIEEGRNLALVSDAGTPGISDPGSHLVHKLKERFKDSISVVSVPGANAAAAALSVAGVPASEFLFLGFLPHKKGRETLFKEITESKRTVVFYESPHRILKTLASLKKHFGDDKKVTVVRELTKIHEETVSGTPSEELEYFGSHPERVRGEFVVIVS